MPRKRKMMLGRDYVMREGRAYYTSTYLATLGTCCNNQCTGCPWERLDPEEAERDKGAAEQCAGEAVGAAASAR